MSATYTYKVVDRSGGSSVGELVGDSKAAVAAQLRLRGLTVVDVDEKITTPTVEDILDRYKKVKSRHITVLARQMATMVASGLSLLRTLYILEEQAEDRKLKKTIVAVREDIEAGFSLSQSLNKHPKVFNELFVSMVRAGETGGALEETLERAAVQMEKDDHLKRTVKAAMVYPVMIGSFAILTLFGMILFIVPIFDKMYKDLGGKLPPLTQFMIDLSGAMRSYWYLMLLAPVGMVFGFKKWKNSHAGERQWDQLKLRAPMKIGGIVRKIAVARFSRTLGTLTASGVPILQSLEITARTAGNRVIADPMDDVIEKVRQGSPIAPPMAKTGVFPGMMTQMVAVGEETGAMDRMLMKLADFYEDEVQSSLKAITSIIEPIMMIFVGAIVGVVVLAMYLPLFKIFDLIQG
jgi:type IV pilus assembly protein PilC